MGLVFVEIKRKGWTMKKENWICLTLLIILIVNAKLYNTEETIEFDDMKAKEILETTWNPVNEFKNNLTVSKKKNLVFPPTYIKTEEEFIEFFTTTLPQRYAKEFYDNLIIEDEENGLIINETSYFPNIHEATTYNINSYIKKYGNSGKQQLIIQEIGLSGESNYSYKRTNYYEMNHKGEWEFEYFDGLSWYNVR